MKLNYTFLQSKLPRSNTARVVSGVVFLVLVLVASEYFLGWPLSSYRRFKTPETKEESLTNAIKMVGEDNYAGAKKELEKAVKNDPGSYDAWLNLGITYLNLKDYQKAISAIKQAAKIDPGSSVAYNILGNAYLLTDDFGLAEESYKKAISLNANEFNAYLNLAHLYLKQSKLNEAIATLKNGKEANPKIDSFDKAIAKLENR